MATADAQRCVDLAQQFAAAILVLVPAELDQEGPDRAPGAQARTAIDDPPVAGVSRVPGGIAGAWRLGPSGMVNRHIAVAVAWQSENQPAVGGECAGEQRRQDSVESRQARAQILPGSISATGT